MLSHQAAKRIASEYLAAGKSPLVVSRATRDAARGVWLVGYVEPERPESVLDGGGLVVTDDGHVHEVGSTPGQLDELLLQLGPSAAMRMVPAGWRGLLDAEFSREYWAELHEFVASERARAEVLPPQDQVFEALRLTPLEEVRVVILGQDPYHGSGQAHGLSFSVLPGVPIPSSLANIHKQLHYDIGIDSPDHGCLDGWAQQGVLLLNTVLTVRAGQPNSHRGSGWEHFTDAVIRAVSAKSDRVVFILWGRAAQRKRRLVDEATHAVLESSHPSGLSAYRGFNTSKPFSETNRLLQEAGRGTIDWSSFRPPC